MGNNEIKLLDGIRCGDSKVLIYCYKTFYPEISKYVLRNNGTQHEAEDLFQEVLLTIHLHPPEKLSCQLKTYIMSIAIRLWYNQLEIKKRNASIYPLHTDFNISYINPEIKHVEEEEVKKSRNQELYLYHFSRLSDSCQCILNLYFKNMTVKEIAQRLRLSEDYVKKRKSEGKQKLIHDIRNDKNFIL